MTTQTSYTPGKWTVGGASVQGHITIYAVEHVPATREELQANIRIVEAGTELVEALEECLGASWRDIEGQCTTCYAHGAHESTCPYIIARSLLERVKGEAK